VLDLCCLQCTFEANTAPTYRGGAIAADENASVTITKSTFTSNVAIEGTLSMPPLQLQVRRSASVDFTLRMRLLACWWASMFYMLNSYRQSCLCFTCVCALNIAGGAIISLAKSMSISYSTFTANKATNNGGAINFDSRRGTNGSIVEYPVAVVSNCEFHNSSATASGGAIFSDRANLTIQQVCNMQTNYDR
jgi:predicted outer membrane repeat protein